MIGRRMCEFFTTLLVAGVLYSGCLTSEVDAQWQVPTNTIPIGRGPGVTGFNSAANTGTGTLCLLNTTPPAFGSCGTTVPSLGPVPRNLSNWANDDPYIEDFGGASGGPDNTPAFNLALASSATGVRFRCGPTSVGYNFNSAPNIITKDFRVSGCTQQSDAMTTVYRNYIETTPTRGLFSWTAGQAYISNLFIVSAAGATPINSGGAAISIIPSVAPAATTVCNIDNVRISAGGAGVSTWAYSLYLDGSALTSPLGLRTCYLKDVTSFGATVRSAFVKSVVHFNWFGGSVDTAGGSDGSLEITGTAGVVSQTITVDLDYIDQNLILDRVIKGTISVGEIAGVVTNTVNTDRIIGQGSIRGGAPQSNWTNSSWLGGTQNYFNVHNGFTFGNGAAGSPNIQADTGILTFAGANAGAYNFDNTVYPATNRAGSLGTASSGWADIYLGGSTSGTLQIGAPAIASGKITFPAGTTNFSATGGASQVVKQVSSGGPFTVSTVANTDLAGLGTGVSTALGVNIGTAGAFVVNGGALGSPSSAGTMPAFTLGGTVSGGGNQINNVIIGNSTPLASSFTTVSASDTVSILKSGGNLLTAAFNSGQVPIGFYTGASSAAVAMASNVTWSSGNAFNIKVTGDWWFWGNVAGVGAYDVCLSTGNGTAGTNADYVTNCRLALTNGGQVIIEANTASTSTTTGAGLITGGLGVGGAIYGGAEITTGVTTFASLPTCNAGRKGARHFITDELAAVAFNTVATGGGANNVPVFCDGTSWRIG